MGTALNWKNIKSTDKEPNKINPDIFSPHFKFLNFSESMGMFETISHDRKRMIASRE